MHRLKKKRVAAVIGSHELNEGGPQHVFREAKEWYIIRYDDKWKRRFDSITAMVALWVISYVPLDVALEVGHAAWLLSPELTLDR